ncbi:hypothetical protein BGZ67_003606 [Mortierella alpina]|nr:hypothetical protein BGZ67_003606 [Mortierella alpina]
MSDCGRFHPGIPVHVNRHVIKSILDGTSSHLIIPKDQEATGRRNLQKLQDLYSSCMNETQIALVGPQPLLDVIEHIVTLFPVKDSPFEHLQSPTFIKTSENIPGINDTSTIVDPIAFSNTLAYFNRLGLDSIASFRVRRKTVSNEITFELHSDDQGQFSELSFPTNREEYYYGTEKDAISNVAKTLHLLMRLEEEEADDLDSLNETKARDVPQKWKHVAMNALHLASRLEKIHRDPKVEPVVSWPISNMSQLANWTLILQSTLPPDVERLPQVKPIGSLVLNLDEHLKHIFRRSAPSSVALQIQSYFVWRAVQQMIQYIDPTYCQFLRPKDGEPKTTERCKICTEFVNSSMGRMIGPYFAQQVHLNHTMAQDMVQTIQTKLAESFNGLSKVPLSTRTREILKLGRALTLVGVTDGAVECLFALEQFYKLYTVEPDDYFGNWIRFSSWRKANTVRGLKGFSDFGEEASGVLPQDVEIRHDLEAGQIQVPMGILQPPFFCDGFPDYVYYATIGWMIAQQYARGLDFGEGLVAKTMKMFCKDSEYCGNLLYNKDNYERSALDDPDVSGRSLGELAARTIGLQIAFDAWKSDSNSTR